MPSPNITPLKLGSSLRRLFLKSSALVAVLVTLPPYGLTQDRRPPRRKVERQFFGLHIHHLLVPYPDGGRSQWPFVQFGSWRIWNAYTAWLDLEPTPGAWNLSRLDLYINMATQKQVEILVTLGKTPTWASARPHEKCGMTPGCAAEPKDLTDWKAYVSTLARRYKGRVAAYEVWNEPAFSEIDPVYRKDGTPIQYFTGSAKEMVRLAESAYEAIKAADPNALVVSPSVTAEGNGLRRLATFLSQGGGMWCDVIGFHFYTSTPEASYLLAIELRKLLAEYGLQDKPIWNTEMGFVYERPDLGIVAAKTHKGWSDPLTTELGVGYLARAHIVMASAGIGRLHWFNWDGEPPHPTMGIAVARGAGKTQLTDAYQKLQGWLVGSIIGQCSTHGSIWTCAITTPTGSQALLVWNTNADSVQLSSLQVGNFKRVEALVDGGSFDALGSADLKVTELPILLLS